MKEETNGKQSKIENISSLGYIGDSSRLYLRSLINMEDEWANLNNGQNQGVNQSQIENRSYESIKYQEYEYEQSLASKGQLNLQQERKVSKPANFDMSQPGGFLDNYYNSYGQNNVYDLIFLGSNTQQ